MKKDGWLYLTTCCMFAAFVILLSRYAPTPILLPLILSGCVTFYVGMLKVYITFGPPEMGTVLKVFAFMGVLSVVTFLILV